MRCCRDGVSAARTASAGFLIRASGVHRASHLVGVAVEEVDAVPRVGGLAFAHPPCNGWTPGKKDNEHNVKQCSREDRSAVPCGTDDPNEQTYQPCFGFVSARFSAARIPETARQRLRAAAFSRNPPSSWGRPGPSHCRVDRSNFKPLQQKTTPRSSNVLIAVDIAGNARILPWPETKGNCWAMRSSAARTQTWRKGP